MAVLEEIFILFYSDLFSRKFVVVLFSFTYYLSYRPDVTILVDWA